ncbi:MAG: tetratricopeptide repeat protein, partial [Pirellulales bacterium]
GLDPKSAELHVGLGDLEAARTQWPQAIAAYQAAITLEPTLAIAEGHLAAAFQAAGALEEAVTHYRRAIELSPQYTTAHYNLGTALDSLGQREAAARLFEAAINLDPTYVDAHVNLGCYDHSQLDMERALASYDRALALSPDSAKARYNRAMCLLTNGKLRDGWSDYEWRMRVPGFPMHSFDRPLWDGSGFQGKTLLVHAEQGLGDTMQFVRYLPLVRQRGGRVILLVDAVLVQLLQQSGCQDVYPHPRDLPDFDVQAPLMSLPGIFGTTLENIPAEVPYLSADPGLVAVWNKRLSGIAGYRVGICWQGNPSLDTDHIRSFPLAVMEPLARVPGVRLVSLQRMAGLNQLAGLAGKFDVVDLGPQFENEAGGFLNAAAVIANLDLVITADTAIAHLAGALGAPVWLALARQTDWRWLRDRSDTPWYPTMRLFRRSATEDWPQLFVRMATDLRGLVENAAPRSDDSHSPETAIALADALADQQQYREAQQHLDRAIQRVPDRAELRRRAGDVQARQAHWSAAIAHYQQALALDPTDAVAECHWAMALQAQEQNEQASEHYRHALELACGHVDTLLELGGSLTLFGNLAEATRCYERALELEPANDVALSNIASLARQLDRCDEALAYLDRAIHNAPDNALAHLERGAMLLHLGDFRRGWDDYRWRAKVGKRACDWIQGPEWDGKASPDTRLLIYAEQGQGDAIQFVRFLPLARQRACSAVLIAHDSLVPLFRQSGYGEVRGFSDPLPEFDCKISLMDLPYVLETTVETIPAEVPYLSASDDLVRQWAARLRDVAGFRVGICWQGSTAFAYDRFRSFPLQALAPLARVPGVRLVSLQKGAGLEQLDTLAGELGVVDLRPEFDHEKAPFFNAAAVIDNLDLVVAADTAIAHLAGAMGAPVWLASSARSDWRWLRHREDSPWYPTMRIFHQQERRKWDELFERIAAELHVLAQRKLADI